MQIQSTSKWAWIWASLLGLLGVILGAMGAHALKAHLNADQLGSWNTGVRYQMYHALLLLFIGLLYQWHPGKWLRSAIYATLIGVVLFSGSIYLLLFTELPIGLLTPLGGLVLIAAWAMLFIQILRYK